MKPHPYERTVVVQRDHTPELTPALVRAFRAADLVVLHSRDTGLWTVRKDRFGPANAVDVPFDDLPRNVKAAIAGAR